MIDEKTIRQIAVLARLELSQTEITQMVTELSKAVSHFQQISQINTEGVEPMVTPTDIESFWRPDEVHAEFSAEEMLALAPARIGNLFKVPPVVG